MGGGGISLPPAAPPAPKKESKEVQEASAEALRRRQRARGFRSTILAKDMMDSNNPALKNTFGA